MKINELLNENSFAPWVEPTYKSVVDSQCHLVPSKTDRDFRKTFELVKKGKIKKIPYSYFKDGIFEPYTLEDLKDPDLEPRVKRIVKGFKEKKIPMVLATTYKNKLDVTDGFSRAAVAMALKIPIYAKVVELK